MRRRRDSGGGNRVRMSALASRELINVRDGSRAGLLGDADLGLDPRTGLILALFLPVRRGFWGWLRTRREVAIPWQAVKKVGPELLIIDFDLDNPSQTEY